ncbi:NUDIX hydrolase [Georgenia alba]|uniref:NUDIX hydrolase n=1 Tax=Georgenia alba TaxID=2233858 RepID=A0ABW2QAP8_9MICO
MGPAETKASLRDLSVRALAGRVDPIGGAHRYDAAVAATLRQAAVLLLFTLAGGRGQDAAGQDAAGPDGLPDLFLVQRSRALRNHPGEIALPGGSLDAGEDAVSAALRENHEEIGLAARHVEVLGELPPMLAPFSGFVVTPVLGWTDAPGEADEVEPGEVLHTLRVSVGSLVDPRVRHTVTFADRSSIGFLLPEGLVWGMTANLLDHVLTGLGWAREWDRGRTVPIRRDDGGVWVPDI